MSDSTPTTDVAPEYFQIRINKNVVKKIALITAATAVVAGAVFVKKNLSIETSEGSDTVNSSGVNGV